MPNGAPDAVGLVAAAIFALAVLHTFSSRSFERLAHIQPRHAGLWHLLAEVEVVFGFWAAILIAFMAMKIGTSGALAYLESRNFTEPAFVFVIMVIAASRPVIDLAALLLRFISLLIPVPQPTAYYVTLLSVGPLFGSFITEPAAMTLTALLLRDRYFGGNAPSRFMYATVGVLFVNVSIGGTLTPYAAPPVLMVAERWGFDLPFMLQTFGWKAALAVAVNAAGVTFLFRDYLRALPDPPASLAKLEVPAWIASVHLAFLAAVVAFNHQPIVFLALFMFFLGFRRSVQAPSVASYSARGASRRVLPRGSRCHRRPAEMVATAAARRHGTNNAVRGRNTAHGDNGQRSADLSRLSC